MLLATTETADPRYADVDLWPTATVVSAIVSSQRLGLAAVDQVAPVLAVVIERLAGLLAAGGRMAYAGAGSSGAAVRVDAMELPGTFGFAVDTVPVLLAGEPDAERALDSSREDDGAAAEAGVDRLGLGPGDALVAVAASGTTPFTVAALRRANSRGALTVGLACVAGTPLLAEAACPVHLATPPEVVAGSTRLSAGTAQKCALNALSTGVAVRLGHVYAGRMVNMAPDNAKLKARATDLVAALGGVDTARARDLLDRAGSVKAAIVMGASGVDALEAAILLARHRGDLRRTLAGTVS